MTALVDVVASHLAEWEVAHVDLAVHGTADAVVIAEAVNAFCRVELGAPVAGGLFHRSSVAVVTGVILADGRRVVVKAHPPSRSPEELAEIARLQRHLAARGLFAPAVLAGPTPFGRGHALIEDFIDGELGDAHDPVIRTALAEALWAITDACAPFVEETSLTVDPMPEGLWPTPHGKLFDFEATARGAEWIDAIARAARSAMVDAGAAGRLVIGHSDWRVEHARFARRRVVAGHDWDSLRLRREPSILGVAAHAFCADWSRSETIAPAPSLDEARSFVAAYEGARGRRLEASERRLLGATFAYACAYTARCGHALGDDERAIPGTFMALVHREGEGLLDW